jgi:hypothetical protein
MTHIWRSVAHGFAQGPERTVTLAGGGQVTITTFWTDEDGVSLGVDLGDEPLNRKDAESVAVAMIQMSAITTPEDLG